MKTKKKILKYKELWSKNRYYDEKCVNIKFHSDDEVPLNKTIEILNMTIVARAIFNENNKHYQQVF